MSDIVRVGSLCSGIGGLELGLEQAGMTTAFQVESDPYCIKVLARHWPGTPRHDDVLTFPGWWESNKETLGDIDLIAAGFPCQPFSLAGKMLGANDERWLWPAIADAIRLVRPRLVLLENVSALVRDGRAFGTILGDLHRLGFDAEWATLRASDYGAPQNRERVYVLAYAASVDGQSRSGVVTGRGGRAPFTARGLPRPPVDQCRQLARAWLAREPRVDRLADGVPAQVDRLRVAGNAVVPARQQPIPQGPPAQRRRRPGTAPGPTGRHRPAAPALPRPCGPVHLRRYRHPAVRRQVL